MCQAPGDVAVTHQKESGSPFSGQIHGHKYTSQLKSYFQLYLVWLSGGGSGQVSWSKLDVIMRLLYTF